MNLIKINEAEAIIEPFYDGGESSYEFFKYSPLSAYAKTVASDVKATVLQGWMSADITIYPTEKELTTAPVILERICDLDVTGYDSFSINATSSNAVIRLTVTTEQGEQVAIEKQSYVGKEMAGDFTGIHLTGIRLEIWPDDSAKIGILELQWFLVANKTKLPAADKSGLKFSKEWTGCFEEEYEIKPQLGIYFDTDSLEQMREKVKHFPFAGMYERVKKHAYDCMDLEPESMIEEYLVNTVGLLCRPGHCYTSMDEYLPYLAFVGMMEEDRDMIRLAGRVLMSICVTPHWCESVLGNLPGATWHRRSFVEGITVKRCAIALDFIGYSLTFHGKNLVYDAMMQKGLPRIESDMFSVEYIRYINQGVVFNTDRIFAYIALSAKYPRYAKMIDIAEADFNEMVDLCTEEDGGNVEGPGYFNYTYENVIECAYVLARYRKKDLKEYASEKMRRASDYALAMLIERPEGLRYMMVNDSYSYGQYNSLIVDYYYRLNGNPMWGNILNAQLSKGGGLEQIWMIKDLPEVPETKFADGLTTLPVLGAAMLRQTLADGTRIQTLMLSGKAYMTHHHEDKGQMVLFADGEEFLSDRGNVSAIGKKPISHNLFVPESMELPYSQPAELGGGRLLHSTYVDGVFSYKADLTPAWESGIFESITREVVSAVPGTFVIEDAAECCEEQPMSLRFNSVCPIKADEVNGGYLLCGEKHTVRITPVDYAPVKVEIKEDGTNKVGQPIHMLILYPEVAKEYKIRTKIELL